MTFLVPFGAGNFLYIAAADLVPEVKKATSRKAVSMRLAFFAAGLALLVGVVLVRAPFRA